MKKHIFDIFMIKNDTFKEVLDIKSLFKAVATLSIFSIITRLLGFLYRIYLSRVLTNSMLGIYTIALSVFGIFNTLLTSGTPLTISKLTSMYNSKNSNITDKQKSYSFVTAGFIISIIAAVLLSIFVISFKGVFNLFFTDNLSYLLLLTMIPAIISTGAYTSFRGYLYGKEKYLHIGIVELIEQILRILICLLLFIFIFPTNTVYPPAISFGIAGVLSTILGIFIYFKTGGKLSKPKNFFKPIIKTSLPITIVRIGGSLIVPIISILIPLRLVSAGLSSENALAQIGIILGMTFPIITIPSTVVGAFSTALIPRTALFFKQNDYTKLNKEVNSSLNFSLILTFLFIPIFFILGEPICEILFNSTTAGTYLSIASWLMIPMCITQLSTAVLNSVGKEAKSFWIYLFASIFLLVSIYILPKYIGATSIIVGMGISTIISSLLNMLLIKKVSGISHNYLKTIFILTLISIPVSFLTKYLYNISLYIFPKIIALGFTGIISVTCFILLLLVFNIMDIRAFYQSIKNKIKKPKTQNI